MERGRRKAEDEDVGLFLDTDFPPDDSALLSDGSTPITKLKDCITFLRPQEICQSPELFPEDINLGHAKQGLLGDCWLLCACTILLQNKHLLNKVIPPDQPLWGDHEYKGIFRFCFWQYGQWKDVIIDDLLPCTDSKLCFSRCLSPTAFWVALLEKAYAKLHGSYERLWAGQVSEALVDLTGGLAEHWSLGSFETEGDDDKQQDTDRVRRRPGRNLVKMVKDNCILSCSTNSRPAVEEASELGQYHALNVLEWLEVSTMSGHKVHLLRIRNPWGRCCWHGSWGEGSPSWSSLDPLCSMDLQARISQGEFWLDEEEFVSMFDDVTAAYQVDENGHLKSIYSGHMLIYHQQLAGVWIKGYSAGGSRNSNSYSTNPKYWLKVRERGEVLVTLLQHKENKRMTKSVQKLVEDRGINKHQHYHAIALHIWKVEKRRFDLSRVLNKAAFASTHCHAYDREVVLNQELEPGYYLMIPSTYQPEAEARFLIRVFSSSSVSLSALKKPALSLPSTIGGEWENSFLQGAWVKGSTAGGSRNFPSHWCNPRFLFSVCDDTMHTPEVNINITLHQNPPEKDLHPIGFHVYKAQDGTSESKCPKKDELVASCIPHCYNEVVSLPCHLPAGVYTIVPSTYEPDCPATFTLCISHRVHRKVVKCQETLGRPIQEISCVSLMHN
ncbi:calpain-10 [Eucyclogobius newberryi]|uniref:calpain-10 n=1 Tax=Eucyclogobius newberryi TaxID=166745 RepID=UPI003B5A1D16